MWAVSAPAQMVEDAKAAYNPGDYAAAYRSFLIHAEQGAALAQFYFGNMYSTGRGVSQDYTEAEKWYRRAADQGLATAQLGLGLMYYEGYGVPQDFIQAHMWFNLAASRLPASNKDLRSEAVTWRDETARFLKA